MTMTQKVFEPLSVDIAARATANRSFREVVSTGPHAQVVVMSIPAGGEIGQEVHPGVDQVLNDGTVDLKLYTTYAPPQHAPGTIHRTKAEADTDEEHA